MLAYHNDPAIKKKYLERVREHRRLDQLEKGYYWSKGKGCAVGCTIHGSDHGAYEIELGIPRILARLEDSIFETLPNKAAMLWPERFLQAIKPGADLKLVWARFAVWLLDDVEHGVIRFAKTDQTKGSIQNVVTAYRAVFEGKNGDINWSKIRTAAYDAYDSAAVSAYAAEAYAAAAAGDYADARVKQAAKLIELLQAA